MKRSVLQIPIDPLLRKQAELVAREEGFSSLQVYVRVLISKIAAKAFTLQFAGPANKEDYELIKEIEPGPGGTILTPAEFERRLNELKTRKKKV